MPLVFAIGYFIYIIARHIGRAWVDHRVRMVLLERLEARPELMDEVQDVIARENSKVREKGQDPVLTGVILALIGVFCVVAYAIAGGGLWAVGAYWGGVACVALGFILALLGLLIRFLTRGPSTHDHG